MHLQRIWSGIFNILCSLTLCAHYTEGWFFPQSWQTNCYTDPPIGCFPTSYPHDNAGGIAPQSPDIVAVRFFYHNNGVRRQRFTTRDARQILRDLYHPGLQTVFIIHGYMENGDRHWVKQMVESILHKEDTNVIVVDWFGGSSNIIYFQSVANTRVVGAVTALLMEVLISLGGHPSDFHLIGFSLGAHVAGHAGSRVSGVGRITGLDPAGPAFEGESPEARLDPTDAMFVDVIHTDTKPSIGMGGRGPSGTVDFYVNGGMDQPGCDSSVMARVSALFTRFALGSSIDEIACCHIRAVRLFLASINNDCTHVSRPCSNVGSYSLDGCGGCGPRGCPRMGYNMDPSTVPAGRHVYWVQTSARWPYC